MPRGRTKRRTRRRSSTRRSPAPRRRRSSVSGISVKKNDKVMLGIGIAGGIVLTALANTKINEMLTDTADPTKKTVSPYLISAAEAAIGWFGPDMLAKGNPLIQGIGLGMIGAATVNALQEADVISGIENVVNGWNTNYRQLNTVNGISNDIQQAASGNHATASANASYAYDGTSIDDAEYEFE